MPMTKKNPMDEIVDRVKNHAGVTLRRRIAELEPHAWSAPEVARAVADEFGIPRDEAGAAVDYLTDLPAEDPRG
jgi:hypothetical protein